MASATAQAEIRRLQRCIGDLVSVLALPGIWSGAEPQQIVSGLPDALLPMMGLDAVYVRLNDPFSSRIVHSQLLSALPGELVDVLDRLESDSFPSRPPLNRYTIGNASIAAIALRLGEQEEIGLLFAGSQRETFPTETERLVLRVAANQVTIAFQEARLIRKERSMVIELDRRVVQRENAMAELRSQLAHTARVSALGALAASIAHEVTQPLTGIITNAGTCLRMLTADPPDLEGARETAARTARDGHRAADVIQRLRALFSKKVIAAEPLDLSEAAREVLALSSSELQRNSVTVRMELSDDLPSVIGDRVQLQQVVLNLILNAIEAMCSIEGRSRTLLVRTERDVGECVRLTVSDSGPGFVAGDIDKVFDAFFTTKGTGMGMGLSVSRTIIESHNGRLWAVANPDYGASFAFSIPCRIGEASINVESS